MKASFVIRSTDAQPGQREVEQLGFGGYVGKDHDGRGFVEISIPFDWMTSTAKYIYYVKKFDKLNNLASATHEWHWVMEGVLKKLESRVPFTLPLQHARLDIGLFKPNAVLGDPDHFWYRPVVDAFVQRRFIMDDNTESLQIHVVYERSPNHPELRIRLTELSNDYHSVFHQDPLEIVF